MDEIDKVQQNNLLPFEQSKKDEVVKSLQRDVDDIGITLQWWMNDFRESWETEYPRAVEQLSDEHWETWYTNFKNFTRQDIKYCFNEIRKTPRDFPPNLSHLYNLTQNNAQTDTNMSFKDISKLMRKLPKRKSLGYGLDQ
jgi:hypothetical protein